LTELEELKAKIEVATQALEDIVVDPTWGLEHETYMRCRAALGKLKEESPMTKLEELKAAWKSAHAAVRAAEAVLEAAEVDYNAADAECMTALEAYEAALKKQEENE
jgi:hypothetical protein